MKIIRQKSCENIFPYIAYIPENVSNHPALLIQLHGAGERGNGGDELEKVLVHGFSKIVNDNNFRYQCKKMTFNAEMTKYCRMVANGKYKQAARNKAGVRAFMFSDEMKNRYTDLIRLKNDELQKDIKVNFDLSADDDTDSDIPVRDVVE